MTRSRPKARFSVVSRSSGGRSTDMDELSPGAGLVMGGLFAAIGLAVVFLGLGWIPIDPSRVHAPMWVIGLSGMVFLLPGLLMCYYAIQNGLSGEAGRPKEPGEIGGPSQLVGGLMVSIFAIIGLWVGFGDGPRKFSGGLTGSDWEGRILFGGIGLLFAMIALGVLAQGLGKLFRSGD